MIQFGGVKLKIEPPSKFTGGSKDNYEDFERRLRTYLSLTDTRFPKLLKWVVLQMMPVSTDQIKTYLAAEKYTEDQARLVMNQMNPFLYYTLVSLIEGSAYTILEQVDEENGIEAYRKLYARFAKTKMQNAIMRMAAIINIKFQDTTFENTFSEWEGEIHKLESALKTDKHDGKLADEVKIGILIAGTTGKIHDHLCLSLNEVSVYADARDIVINYLKSRNLTMISKKSKPDWMEVDAINTQWKGKGKDNKGKGKGKDGGKGGQTNRWCHNCKSTTHDTKFCWAGKAGKAGKGGKGKGKKGKGKGKGIKGLWTEWPEEENYDYDWWQTGEEYNEDPTTAGQQAPSTTTEQVNYENASSGASTVAAIHYKRIVGEPQDNDLSRTMSINMIQTKLAVMGLTKRKAHDRLRRTMLCLPFELRTRNRDCQGGPKRTT